MDTTDRYGIVIERQEQIEQLSREWGFLPFFKHSISGFSIEEMTPPELLFGDDFPNGPWGWKGPIIANWETAYGKFFNKKAGFISKEWLPHFVNHRRDGYDFDARWEDELASMRQKKIMDLFENEEALFSFDTKKKAGFGKGGEKNFDGVVTELQMQMYLCLKDFRKKKNKAGLEYGWPIAVYTTPENIFGYEYVRSAYKEDPVKSAEKILSYMKERYPVANEKQMRKVLGIK